MGKRSIVLVALVLVALAASLGSDLLSSIRRSIFRPPIPPFAFSQSRAISAPIRT